MQAAKGAEKCRFCPWWPWPLTLTFKLVRARNQTHLLCKFGANPFSSCGDISYTNKKPQTDGVNNRTCRSSLCAVNIVVSAENENVWNHQNNSHFRRWWLKTLVVVVVVVVVVLVYLEQCDNVYDAVIMTVAIVRVHPVHLMNAYWAPGGRQPSVWTSWLWLCTLW